MAEALTTNSTLTTLYLNSNRVGAAGAVRLAEALTINSTLSTLGLYWNQLGDEGAGRLAEALTTNFSLTEVSFDWNLNTRSFVGAHLDRNKRNLENKSASLFNMLGKMLGMLDHDEFSELASLCLDISFEIQSPSSDQQWASCRCQAL